MTKAIGGNFVLTKGVVQKVIKVVDAGLSSGIGFRRPGHMCVEAAVCYALGLPHGDDPECVDLILRSVKIRLNDAEWPSKKARAEGLRRLAVLQLGTLDVLDNKTFMKKVTLMIITTVLPFVLNNIGLSKVAERCAAAKTLEEGIAASYAASYAARAVNTVGYMADAADYAAGAAGYAARAADYAACSYAANAAHAACSYAANAVNCANNAAHAACRYANNAVKVLKTYAEGVENILIEMKVPAIEYLNLL